MTTLDVLAEIRGSPDVIANMWFPAIIRDEDANFFRWELDLYCCDGRNEIAIGAYDNSFVIGVFVCFNN